MNNYLGKGNLITRLLGRLEVIHGKGVIEFRLRSPIEIEKRGVRTVLRIEGLGDIPRLEDGMTILIDMKEHTAYFVKKRDRDGVHSDRPENSEGVA